MIRYLVNIIAGALSLMKGLAVTFKNSFRRAVTLQYPSQKQPMAERFRGLVDLNPDKCIICYQCVKICPTGCLAISHKETAAKKKELARFEYNMELCCFCGFCDQICPTQAIYMSRIYEAASYGRGRFHINLLNKDKYDEWLHPSLK